MPLIFDSYMPLMPNAWTREIYINQMDINQGPRNNINDIETPLVVKNRLLVKAELFGLPGFRIFVDNVLFSGIDSMIGKGKTYKENALSNLFNKENYF